MKPSRIKTLAAVTRLLDRYGALLTETQRTIVRQHYEADLSLSEIAHELAISKTAVSDALKRSVQKMQTLEAKLRWIQKEEQLLLVVKSLKLSPDQEDRLIAAIQKSSR